jgi:hypothetical protein
VWDLHSTPYDALKIIQRLRYTFSRESVQSPEHKYVKSSVAGVPEHRLEADPLSFSAAILVLVLLNDFPLPICAVLPQLATLILHVLAFVSGRDSEVKGGSHIRAPI